MLTGGSWFVTLVTIAAILTVNYILSGPTHVGSPVVVRLAAAAIGTACAAVARIAAGPRAVAGTGVAGVLIAVIVLNGLP